jgi:hypothetical protein
MKIHFFAIIGLLALPTAAQQDGNSGAYCADNFWNSSDTLMWHIDHDSLPALNGMVNYANYLTAQDFAIAVDQVLQNTARHSRARMRHRVLNNGLYETCEPGAVFSDGACIATVTDSESNLCNQDKEGDGKIDWANPPANTIPKNKSVAWAGCNGPLDGLNCFVSFCSTNRQLNWRNGAFHRVLSHELGHTFGLRHVTFTDDTVMPTTVTPNCATSDGCEGEIMCEDVGQMEAYVVRQGDGSGIRTSLGSSIRRGNRKVAFGSRLPAASVSTTVADPLARAVAFPPRIDCSTFTNNYATCVGIFTKQLANNTETTDIVSFLGPQAAGGWNSQFVVATSTASVQLASDIAVDPLGTRVFFTRVSETNSVASINTVDVTTNSAISSTSLGYRAAFPVRVAWDDDIGGALVLGAAVVGLGKAPQWKLQKVAMVAGAMQVTTLDFGSLDNQTAEGSLRPILADYDFACQTKLIGTSTCTVVALLGSQASANDDPGMYYSRRFSVAPNGVVTLIE